MDDTIVDDFRRHGNGQPKDPEQLKRWRENRCVYCGTPKSDRGVLGAACDKKECQAKWCMESKLTDKQTRVMDGIVTGLPDKQIADQMRISVDCIKGHKRAIARKFGVPCNRVLLARCYIERHKYILP